MYYAGSLRLLGLVCFILTLFAASAQGQGIGDPCVTGGTAGCPDGGYCDVRGGLNTCIAFEDPTVWPCDPMSLTDCTCDRNGDGSDCPVFEANTTCGTNVLVTCGSNGRCSNSSGANSSDECSDGNQCTDDTGNTCKPTPGGPSFWCEPSAINEPLGTGCDLDSDLCATADTCDGNGTCQAGAGPLVCDDGLFCTGAESCDVSAGCQAGSPPCTGVNEVCDEAGDFCDTSLPTEMASFTAVYTGSYIDVRWKTLSETDNAGFGVEVSRDGLGFTEVGFVQGQGTTPVAHDYAFQLTPQYPGLHYIRLRQVDLDGTLTHSLALTLNTEVPGRFTLKDAYPNPFQNTTQVEVTVDQEMPVTLAVYNSCGKQIKTLFEGRVPAGAGQRFTFDGTGLAAGVYFYRLTTPYGATVRTVTLIP